MSKATFIQMISKIKSKDNVLSNFNHNDLLELYSIIEYFDDKTKEEWYVALNKQMNGVTK